VIGTVLYADVLFFINLSMDFLTLYITASLTHTKGSPGRMIAAAALGAGYGVLAVLLTFHPTLSLLGSFAVSMLMTLITFGCQRGFGGLLRQSFLVWGSGSLLGGFMSVLVSLGEPVYFDHGDRPSYARYFVITFAAAIAFVRLFLNKAERKNAEVVFRLNGEVVRFTALADSGNLLREPLGGNPVIIASADLMPYEIREQLKGFMNMNAATTETVCAGIKLKIRLIPQKTVGGSGVLPGFVPDEITVNGIKKAAVIAVDEKGKKRGYGGFDGIVPMSLCD